VVFLGAHTRVTRIRSAMADLLSALQDQFPHRLHRTVYISYCTHCPVAALPISYIAVFNEDITYCSVVPGAPTSRKHSLSLPPTGPRPVHNGGLGGGLGEVDMSAYKSMAASLQAQTEAHQVRTVRTDNTLRLEWDLIGVLYGIYDVMRCGVIQGDMI
jgi:hypothetical protein